MAKREIVSLVIKLMGVFILIKTLAYVPMSLVNLFSVWQTSQTEITEKTLFTIMAFFLALIPIVFALLIIVLSDKVAAWLIKEREDKIVEFSDSIQKEDVMLVVFTCFGLYLIVTAFPNLILYLFHYLTLRRSGGDYVSYTSGGLYNFSRIIAPIAQLILGVWLFIGSRGIVKLWRKIRS